MLSGQCMPVVTIVQISVRPRAKQCTVGLYMVPGMVNTLCLHDEMAVNNRWIIDELTR